LLATRRAEIYNANTEMAAAAATEKRSLQHNGQNASSGGILGVSQRAQTVVDGAHYHHPAAPGIPDFLHAGVGYRAVHLPVHVTPPRFVII
jgi:hypothetical protein